MDDRPPFDHDKHCFWLVAAVLAAYAVVAMFGVVHCTINWADIKAAGANCDQQDKFMTLLTGALAAALAFSGRNGKKD